MADREKVIKAIDICLGHGKCHDCHYSMTEKGYTVINCRECMLRDALALLKEQEAKWVEDKQGEHCRLIKCSNCGLTFIVGNNIPYDEWIEDRNYCRRCGARMVKRND